MGETREEYTTVSPEEHSEIKKAAMEARKSYPKFSELKIEDLDMIKSSWRYDDIPKKVSEVWRDKLYTTMDGDATEERLEERPPNVFKDIVASYSFPREVYYNETEIEREMLRARVAIIKSIAEQIYEMCDWHDRDEITTDSVVLTAHITVVNKRRK